MVSAALMIDYGSHRGALVEWEAEVVVAPRRERKERRRAEQGGCLCCCVNGGGATSCDSVLMPLSGRKEAMVRMMVRTGLG